MDWILLYRFHLVPALSSANAAVRQGPLMAGVALFLAASLVGLTLSGNPVLKLPPEFWSAAGQYVGLTALGALVLWLAGRGTRGRWRVFFEVRPRGPRAWRMYRAAQALGSWAISAAVLAGLSGPDPALLALTGAAALPFTLAAAFLGGRAPAEPARTGGALRIPGPAAWWVSKPLLFGAPLALWAALMAWAVSGQAGFVWADRPPVASLLLDFGWVTVFGLLWSEVPAQLPYGYFRLARAPFRRVLAAVGLPVAAATLAVLAVEALWAGSPGEGFRAAVLTLSGTAFWFAVWLRWGPATLAHLMLFVTLFLVGAAAQQDWWPLWAAVQTVGALAAGAGWRTRYYEGESHAGS